MASGLSVMRLAQTMAVFNSTTDHFAMPGLSNVGSREYFAAIKDGIRRMETTQMLRWLLVQ